MKLFHKPFFETTVGWVNGTVVTKKRLRWIGSCMHIYTRIRFQTKKFKLGLDFKQKIFKLILDFKEKTFTLGLDFKQKNLN